MTTNEFRNLAETNQSIADYLDEIVQDTDEENSHRSIGIDLFFGIAASLLYMYVRNHLDFKRGAGEAELRRLMEPEIERFIEKGFSREEALAAVLAVNKAVKTRPPDESLIKTILSMITQGKNSIDTE